MAKKKTNNILSTQYPSGMAFLGAVFVGLAVGILKDNVQPYLLMGCGVGFVLVAIISLSGRNRYLDR